MCDVGRRTWAGRLCVRSRKVLVLREFWYTVRMIERYSLHTVVFVASFVVMALEVIGLGILAPNYSTALIVQTNVIGIVLIGLAIGYRIGGVRADRGISNRDLSRLLLLTTVYIALVFSFRELIANSLAWYTSSIALGSLLTATTLFGFPSITLGMVLPYAIKLHVENVTSSGKSTGILYALATLGSIGGTLVTAFFVLPVAQHAGSVFLVFLMLVGALILFRETRVTNIVGTLFVGIVFLYVIPIPETLFHKNQILADGRLKSDVTAWKELADESGVFSRIQVYEGTEYDTGRPMRFMLINGQIHSGIFTENNDLVSNYFLYNRLGGHFNPTAKKVLLVGGGAYSYANYLLTDTPLYDIEKVWLLDGRYYHNGRTLTVPILFTNNPTKRKQGRELAFTSSSTPTQGEEEGPQNYIEVENQEPGSTVFIKRADISSTGFPKAEGYISIQETKNDGVARQGVSNGSHIDAYLYSPKTIVGVSEFIRDKNTDLNIKLDRPAREGEVMYVTIHRDNGNGRFDNFLNDGNAQLERLDVVEIDSRTTRLAKQYFGLNSQDPRLRIFHEDARKYYNRTIEKYDVIYTDAFRNFFAVPWQLSTVEATQKLYEMLNENGVIVANVPASLKGPYSSFFQAELKTFQAVFPEVRVFTTLPPNNETSLQSILLIAFKTKESVRENFSDDPEINKQLGHRWYGDIEEDTRILTDDYAPTDFFTNSFAELHYF